MKPLLSICIPTYNRSSNLARALDSIIIADGFGEEVEVVISDNASTDDTQKIGMDYASRYPNIKYYRNEENIRDSNFPLALDRGTGAFKQLSNDNRVFHKDALNYMLGAIVMHVKDRTPLFFSCGFVYNVPKGADKVKCNGLDGLLTHLSFVVTGIWAFGAWKEDWDLVQDKMKYSPLQLSQEDWFFQIVKRRGECVLMTKEISHGESFGVRKGYNWFQVQVDNYNTIKRPYYEAGEISKTAYRIDQKLQLKRMRRILVTALGCNIISKEWQFDLTGYAPILWKIFKDLPYFYVYVLTSPLWIIGMIVKHRFIKKPNK